jgi:TIR domain
MPTVFLSYSQKDHVFAELVESKLADAKISLWREQGQLRAGSDWQQRIEQGISESLAALIVLSTNSAESSYVTYEWAYALGKGKALIPIKLNECLIHRRLQTIQHLDFTVPGSLPWKDLIKTIRDIDSETETLVAAKSVEDGLAKAILAYLNRRGFQMMSFERIRSNIDENASIKLLNELIEKNPTVFRHATLREGKPGLAKLIP